MAVKSRAARLKGIGMPAKPAGEKEADMDLESLSAPDKDGEAGQDAGLEDILGAAGKAPMGAPGADEGAEHLSDDELLAELKKRGLMAKSSPVGAAAEHDIMGEEGEHDEAEPAEENAEEDEGDDEGEEGEEEEAPMPPLKKRK